MVGIIFIGSYIYYSNLNSAEDPRVLEAKKLQLVYDKGLEGDETEKALDLLDEMKDIYQTVPGYGKSYEVGVIFNNKATVYLIFVIPQLMELQEKMKEKKDKVDNFDKIMNNLVTAKGYTEQSIGIYEGWLQKMGDLTENQVREKITPFFDPQDSAFKGYDYDMIFNKRIDDIMNAQFETKRRLSVTLTNLGVINRYQGNLNESKANYEKALELWEKNYTAKDNLNMLMNLPKERRSMLERFFPPERLNKDGEKQKF